MKREQLADNVTLYLGDCRDVLPTLPENSIDAIVTDPPYGIKYFHSGGGRGGFSKMNPNIKKRSFHGKENMIIGDDKPFDPTHLLGFKKVLLFGANHFSHHLPSSSKWIVWDKLEQKEMYGRLHFADCEIAWTNQKGVARIYQHLWQGCRRKIEGNRTQKIHPNQKPIMLFQWCFDELKIAQGETVCDPYMGSGSCAIAAIRTGRKFIGFEVDPKYFRSAVKRIKEELSC